MEEKRKRLTAEEKVGVLRRHLVDKVPVSALCEEHEFQPTQFYQWQKQFFENGAAAFAQPVISGNGFMKKYGVHFFSNSFHN